MNSKTRFAKVSLAVLIVLAMVVALSACNLFGGITKIENVDINVSGLGDPNSQGAYEIGAGGTCSLSVDWHSFLITDPNIKWFVSENGGEKHEIEGEKKKTLSFTAGSVVGATYEISASANSVESKNSIKIVVVSGVKDVTVSVASGLGEKNGAGAYEVEAGNEFSLTANWTNVVECSTSIQWYVSTNGGERQLKQDQTAKNSTWSAITAGTTYEISASVNGVDSSNTITVVIIAGDTPLSIVFSVQTSGISDSDSDGYAEAKFGKTFTVEANLGGLLIESPTFDWYVKEDGVERKLSGTSESITFTIESREIAHYEFRAVLKGESDTPSTNAAKVEFVDSTLETPTITTSTHSIVEGKIQQNIVDGATDVTLEAHWNDDELPADVVTISWRVDNVVQAGEENAEFTFDVSGISSACEKVVKVVIGYKGQTVNATITLAFVEEFKPVASVSLSVDQTSEVSKIGGLDVTYRRRTLGDVTLHATVTPAGTNLGADCIWTVRDMSGTTRTLTDKGRTVTIDDLVYGKNVITATIDNMASRSVIVYILSDDDYSARRYAIEETFIWNGSVQDHYISNQEELNIFIGYLVSTHETAADLSDPNVHNVYLAPSEWRSGVNTSSEFYHTIIVDGNTVLDPECAFGIAMHNGVDESGTPKIGHSGNQKFWLSPESILGEPTEPIFTDYHVIQENVYVRYSKISEISENRRTKIPADDFAETMLVKNSNQLVRALMWGYKPTFEDNAEGTRLASLYARAKFVLLDYIDKNMTELEKVGVIFDWIVKEIDYDYAAFDYTGSDSVMYNAYYLEGVFDDGRAVCDGKSKAFALLCGMEGIRALRIIGTADGGGHAWNKVLVDADGDGVREWYVVDCTWGDIGTETETLKERKEILTYQYFLTTDAKMASTHSSSMAQPEAVTNFNVYASITINGATLDVTTKEQIDLLYAYSLAHEKVKIRCRISEDAMGKRPVGSGCLSLSSDEENVYYFYAK